MSKASKLIACLLNVSEARNSQLIENIAKAAISTNSPTTDFKCDSVVLNIFSDKIYNRSVISIGGKFNSLIKAKLPVLDRSRMFSPEKLRPSAVDRSRSRRINLFLNMLCLSEKFQSEIIESKSVNSRC